MLPRNKQEVSAYITQRPIYNSSFKTSYVPSNLHVHTVTYMHIYMYMYIYTHVHTLRHTHVQNKYTLEMENYHLSPFPLFDSLNQTDQ